MQQRKTKGGKLRKQRAVPKKDDTIRKLMKPGDRLSKTTGVRRADAPPPGWIVSFTWPNPITFGNCKLLNATLYLYSDTSIHFSSYFESDAGDVWIIRALVFYDKNHAQIGEPVPQHDSAPGGEGVIPFVFQTTIPGTTPNDVGRITSVNMICYC
jgi:hypothetical protein